MELPEQAIKPQKQRDAHETELIRHVWTRQPDRARLIPDDATRRVVTKKGPRLQGTRGTRER